MLSKRSEFACKCGCGENDIGNNLVARVNMIEKRIGRKLDINSGYRCPKHPLTIKNPTSSHAKGWAVDIECINSAERFQLISALIVTGVTRIGVYDRHIHFDIDMDKPQGVMWYGKY